MWKWILGTALLLYYILPNLIFRRPPKSKAVVFSFDDGPTPGVTERVLDLLKENHLHGYFFVLGEKAERHPELIRRIVAEGHELGIHGYVHRHGAFQNPVTQYGDLKKAVTILHDIGVPVRYFRPPHGFYTLTMVIFCMKYGLKPFHWDALLQDWEKPAPEVLAKRCEERSSSGGVLVFHDGSEGKAVPDACQVMPEGLEIFLSKTMK